MSTLTVERERRKWKSMKKKIIKKNPLNNNKKTKIREKSKRLEQKKRNRNNLQNYQSILCHRKEMHKHVCTHKHT